MDWIRSALSRCAALFRRRNLDANLDEELRAHIDLAIADNLKSGISPEDARTVALRAFGGLTQTREAYRVQRDLPWAMIMQAQYLGIKGTRALQDFLPNTYPPGAADPCLSCPSGYVYLQTHGRSSRHAGQVHRGATARPRP